MRWVLSFLALLIILFGAVWLLQGINILPGSFMTGRVEWAVAGAGAVAVGVGLLVFANRKRKSSNK
jgi:uncharacterized membrane protein HdeD (DUF308 family)